MARYLLWHTALERDRKKSLINKRRRLRKESLPMELPDREFIANFRLSKTCFEELCDELVPLLSQGSHSRKIDTRLRILAALSFFSSGSYQRSMGANHLLGMSQTTMSRSIKEVTDALNHPTILSRYIKFPYLEEERRHIMKGFMEKFGMPGVIGCVDGTHVAMIAPTENQQMFLNRKHYYSRNVQIICDDQLNILHVDATFGGASHDSFIWNSCPVKGFMEHLNQNGEAVWLLGDLGYAQRSYMMTPIPNSADGSPEAYYNGIHIRVRNTVERCIGVLKSRWRCLLAHRVLHYHHLTVAKIVNACCVLHNIANKNRLAVPTDDPDSYHQDLELQIEENVEGAVIHEDVARSALVRRLWSNRRQI